MANWFRGRTRRYQLIMIQAELHLFPQQFKLLGPPMLLATVQAVLSGDSPPEQIKYRLEDTLADWYVICSISGEKIRLSELKYWDVDKQEVYARPELVPALGWYVPLT